MAARILLSTYVIKIQDKQRNDQLIDKFNGSSDFFTTLEGYFKYIFSNLISLDREKEDGKVNFTLANPAVIDKDKRTMYGYFKSGVSGEEFDIYDVRKNEKVGQFKKDHAGFREVFFYIYAPKTSKVAYVVLQRRSTYGVKVLFEKTLQKYFKDSNFQDNYLYLNNLLSGKVYNAMMEQGQLKKIEFIKRSIPASMEEYQKKNEEANQIKGVLKQTLIAPKGLPDSFKKYINKIYTGISDTDNIEFTTHQKDYDEIEFELEVNGKQKKFYVNHKSRAQPDVDVTALLTIKNGVPTLESLIRESINLIEDIKQVKS
jgi:hypothetical protein